MFPYLSAVMPQIAYAHSVRDFIRELLRRFIPGKWIDRVISDQDANFDTKLGAAFASLDEMTATEKDYCAKVVSVLCDEVSRVCEVTRLVCINRGYEEYADTFLSTEKFIRLLLRQDTMKLKRLNATLAEKSKPLCVLLRDVGAVLEDRSAEEVAVFGAAEVKKANAELKAIAADVKKTMQTGFAEVRSDIATGVAAVGDKVDAVAAKVSRLRRGNRPRGRYTKEARALCWNFWETAANHEEVWCSVNTRITYKSVFVHYQARLAKVGVNGDNEFRSIIRAEERHRNRDLHSKQDEARRKQSNNHPIKQSNNQKYGIMRDVKRHAKSALALTLAIAGGLAAPLRSDAANDTFLPATRHMPGISHFRLLAS